MGGSIHCNENIAYSMKEMGAGIEVIKILKEGYSLPFTRLPGQYREKNNHSAKKHGTKVIPPPRFYFAKKYSLSKNRLTEESNLKKARF